MSFFQSPNVLTSHLLNAGTVLVGFGDREPYTARNLYQLNANEIPLTLH